MPSIKNGATFKKDAAKIPATNARQKYKKMREDVINKNTISDLSFLFNSS